MKTHEELLEQARLVKLATDGIYKLMVDNEMPPNVGVAAIATCLATVMINLGATKEQAVGGFSSVWDTLQNAQERTMQ